MRGSGLDRPALEKQCAHIYPENKLWAANLRDQKGSFDAIAFAINGKEPRVAYYW